MVDSDTLKELLNDYKKLFKEDYIVYDVFNCDEELVDCIKNKKKQKKQDRPSHEEIEELRKRYKEKYGVECYYGDYYRRGAFYCKYYILNELRKSEATLRI